MSTTLVDTTTVALYELAGRDVGDRARILAHWSAFVERRARLSPLPLSYHPGWVTVLEKGLGHIPYGLEASKGGETVGLLPLAFVRSLLFGRFLVGLPYLNHGGVIADDEEAARLLIDRAVDLADRLDVRYLELRGERKRDHPALVDRPGPKVLMRRPLPETVDALWNGLSSGVRNQVRKGRKSGLTVDWGGLDQLPAFYDVFSRNMRDLGTPVFGRSLFRSMIESFPDRAEFCVVRLGPKPVASGLLVHGWGVTEVPSASSLRSHNSTCSNMLLYWHLLERSVERGQSQFDFGRSTPGGSHAKFKEQWGASPSPAEWQLHPRRGEVGELRADNPKMQRYVNFWKRLPVPVTRWLGPSIVRAIP